MTEKRYFLHKHLGRDVINDTLCHNWLEGEELEEHMNVQYTKYSALKKENEELNELATKCSKLEKENEQLKSQLRKGEDVCSICKHQYLTKRDTDKYYIAKCKKEHNECSRGTVNYCEDFKFKELKE